MKATKFVMQQPMNMISITMTEDEAEKLQNWIEDCSAYDAECRESKKQILNALTEALAKVPEGSVQEQPEPLFDGVPVDENGISF